LLKRFKAKEISQTEALTIIRGALSLRAEVRRAMIAAFGDSDCTFRDFNMRLKAAWSAATSVDAKRRLTEVFRKFAILWLCIGKNFRDGWLA
jgi:ketosteroid isomerase-like protein